MEKHFGFDWFLTRAAEPAKRRPSTNTSAFAGGSNFYFRARPPRGRNPPSLSVCPGQLQVQAACFFLAASVGPTTKALPASHWPAVSRLGHRFLAGPHVSGPEPSVPRNEQTLPTGKTAKYLDTFATRGCTHGSLLREEQAGASRRIRLLRGRLKASICRRPRGRPSANSSLQGAVPLDNCREDMKADAGTDSNGLCARRERSKIINGRQETWGAVASV